MLAVRLGDILPAHFSPSEKAGDEGERSVRLPQAPLVAASADVGTRLPLIR